MKDLLYILSIEVNTNKIMSNQQPKESFDAFIKRTRGDDEAKEREREQPRQPKESFDAFLKRVSGQ